MTTCSASPEAEFDISGLEAMLAGTLCLMSAYAHCHCSNEGNSANNQGLISLKIISNLTCLQCQNGLSAEFRRVLAKVCDAWRQHSLLAHSDGKTALSLQATSTPLWHSAPTAVQ
jgi:hypothetical protein